jgi:hypothetical protein
LQHPPKGDKSEGEQHQTNLKLKMTNVKFNMTLENDNFEMTKQLE